MSYHSDGEPSPDEDDHLSEQDVDLDDQEQPNAFVTDDAYVHLSTQHPLDDIEPIEARPPHEVDVDEQARHQSGTPAFRTLDDVSPLCNANCSCRPCRSLLRLVIQGRRAHRHANGAAEVQIHGSAERSSAVRHPSSQHRCSSILSGNLDRAKPRPGCGKKNTTI